MKFNINEIVKVATPSTRKRIITAPQEPLHYISKKTSKDGKHFLWFDSQGMPACTNFQRINGRICALCGNTCITFKVNQDCDIICSACCPENVPVAEGVA
jgi:hypothetical protein